MLNFPCRPVRSLVCPRRRNPPKGRHGRRSGRLRSTGRLFPREGNQSMSTQTERPQLRQGDLVRFIYDRDHVETVESCEWVATPIMLSAARRESLRICEQAFARRNPELFEKLNAEFEGMTDAELAVIARWPHRWQVVTNWPGNRRVADAAEFLIERGRAMG